MDDILSSLRRTQGVAGAFVVDQSGTLLAADPATEDAQLRGALLGAFTGAMGRTLHFLDLGPLSETVVEADDGAIIAAGCGNGRSVIVLVQGKPNLGLIRLEMRKVRQRLGERRDTADEAQSGQT